jgi:hypothetical protein
MPGRKYRLQNRLQKRHQIQKTDLITGFKTGFTETLGLPGWLSD